jgi:hypothetical protein
MRVRWGLPVIVAVLMAGCSRTAPSGVVEGTFRLPGRPASDLSRAGLNFSTGRHGPGHGQTTKVGADGSYQITLPAGSYSVLGALSGQSGGAAPEACAAAMNVVVKAKTTTQADYVCNPTPVANP